MDERVRGKAKTPPPLNGAKLYDRNKPRALLKCARCHTDDSGEQAMIAGFGMCGYCTYMMNKDD